MNRSNTSPDRPRSHLAAALLVVPWLAATTAPALAGADAEGPFEEGARCLFIGHSFFVPVAVAFDNLAAQNDFPLHAMDREFRSGAAGSPGAMWNDPDTRDAVEAVLATGEVELFGLTAFGDVGSGFDDYAQWFDLALQYNPETRFFIGTPWVFGGPSLETDVFDSANETFAYTTFEVVDQLRTAYPDCRIDYIAYGKTASIMKGLFDVGELPDIVELVGLGPDALFVDGVMGHGGPMMLELSALSWMHVLYGAEVETLTFTEYESDVAAIVAEVLSFNEPFQPLRSGDVNYDGVVNIDDFLALLAAWGPCPDPCPPSCPADFDGDCEVGVPDLLLQLANWG
jgi:hypothetical protein